MGRIIPYIMEKHMFETTNQHIIPIVLWPFIIPDSPLRGTLAVAEGFVQAQQIHVVQAFEHGHLTTKHGFEWEVAMKK